jgi:hypothetical protein
VTVAYGTAPIQATTAREAVTEAPRFRALIELTTQRAAER